MRCGGPCTLTSLLGCLLGAWLTAADCPRAAAAKLLEARVTQAGEVRLKASFSARDTATQVSRLRLVRVDGAGDGWRLPADEVERTGQAAGLDVSRPPWWWARGGLTVLAALAAVIGLTAWLRSRREGPDSDGSRGGK
jgi:hypothetical protein